jgi:hypothetical protein
MAPHITHPVVGRRSCRERAHSRSGRRPNKFYCRKVDEAVKFTASSSGIVVYHNTFIAPKLWNNMTHYRRACLRLCSEVSSSSNAVAPDTAKPTT